MTSNSPPRRYPPAFDTWPCDDRADYLTLLHSREGLLRLALHLAGYGIRREIDSQTRLRKAELAAIVLALDPNTESPSHSNQWD
jgi:hypothetical protein